MGNDRKDLRSATLWRNTDLFSKGQSVLQDNMGLIMDTNFVGYHAWCHGALHVRR